MSSNRDTARPRASALSSSDVGIVRAAQQAARKGATLGGALGLLIGGVVSVLHVLLNSGLAGYELGVGAALASLVFFVLFYGVGFSLGSAVASGLLAVGATWLPRWARQPRREGGWPGVLAVSLVYFLAVALYGLTYDQTRGVHPTTIVGMTCYLVVAGLLVCLVVTLAVRVADRQLCALGQSGRLARSALVLVAILAVGHVLLGLFAPGGLIPGPPNMAETEVEIRETGLRVVILGLDGTDPRVVDRLIEEGELPEWSERRLRGSHGPLATLKGANSAVIWATMYSGYDRRDHGILDFYRVQIPGTGKGFFPVHRTWFKEVLQPLGLLGLQVVSRSELKRFPIWEITDHFGLETGVVDGYFYSYPAMEPTTPGGYFLSYGLDTFLASAQGEAMRDLPLYLQPVDLFEGASLPEGVDLEWQTDATVRLLESKPQPQLLNFYAHEPDAIQHSVWSGWEPERFFPWQRQPDAGDMLEKHRRFDRLIRDVEAAADENTVFLLVSDHGHSATPVHKLSSQHRHGPPGVVLAWGGPVRSGFRLDDADVFDLFPTVLHLLGMPVPADAPGRVLDEMLEPSFMDQFPVRTVPRYQGMWKARLLDEGRGRELNEEELEKLRSMGYL